MTDERQAGLREGFEAMGYDEPSIVRITKSFASQRRLQWSDDDITDLAAALAAALAVAQVPHEPIRALRVARCSCGYEGQGENFDRAYDDVLRHVRAVAQVPAPDVTLYTEKGDGA